MRLDKCRINAPGRSLYLLNTHTHKQCVAHHFTYACLPLLPLQMVTVKTGEWSFFLFSQSSLNHRFGDSIYYGGLLLLCEFTLIRFFPGYTLIFSGSLVFLLVSSCLSHCLMSSIHFGIKYIIEMHTQESALPSHRFKLQSSCFLCVQFRAIFQASFQPRLSMVRHLSCLNEQL